MLLVASTKTHLPSAHMKLRLLFAKVYLVALARSSHLSMIRSIQRRTPSWTGLAPSEIILDVLKISPGYDLDDPKAPSGTYITDFIASNPHIAVFGAISDHDGREFTISYTGSFDPTDQILDNFETEFKVLSNLLEHVEGINRPLMLSPIYHDSLESGRDVFSRYMISEPVDELCINTMNSRDISWDHRLEYLMDFAVSGLYTLRELHTAGWVHGGLSRTSFAQRNEQVFRTAQVFTVLIDFSNACALANCSQPTTAPQDPISVGLFALTQGEHRSIREDLFRFGEVLYRMWNEQGFERELERAIIGLEPTSPQYKHAIIHFKSSFETSQVFWLAHEDPELKALDDYMHTVRKLKAGEMPPYTYLLGLFSSAKNRDTSFNSF